MNNYFRTFLTSFHNLTQAKYFTLRDLIRAAVALKLKWDMLAFCNWRRLEETITHVGVLFSVRLKCINKKATREF